MDLDRNDPNSDTDEELNRSTKYVEGNIYAEDAAKMINEKKSISINEEKEVTTTKGLNDFIEMFP